MNSMEQMTKRVKIEVLSLWEEGNKPMDAVLFAARTEAKLEAKVRAWLLGAELHVVQPDEDVWEWLSDNGYCWVTQQEEV
jgi:hypothetical protein